MSIQRTGMALLALCGMGLCSLAAWAEEPQEGLWDLSVSMSVAGGGPTMGPFNRTQCFTQADTRNPEKLFAEIGAECSYGDRHYQGNRFSFTIQCGGAIPMNGSGTVEFSGSHFQGEMLLNASIPSAGPLETRSQVAGTRRGPCQGS